MCVCARQAQGEVGDETWADQWARAQIIEAMGQAAKQTRAQAQTSGETRSKRRGQIGARRGMEGRVARAVSVSSWPPGAVLTVSTARSHVQDGAVNAVSDQEIVEQAFARLRVHVRGRNRCIEADPSSASQRCVRRRGLKTTSVGKRNERSGSLSRAEEYLGCLQEGRSSQS